MGIKDLFIKSEIPKDERDNLDMARTMATKITCIFYILVGEIFYEVGRTQIPSHRRKFGFAKEDYLVNTKKVKFVKPWNYFWTRNYQAYLEYVFHQPEPMHPMQSDLRMDADSLARVTNERNIQSLIPNPNQKLEMITLIALGIAAISIIAVIYLVAVPDAPQQLRDLVTNKKIQPSGSTAPTNSTGHVVVITPPPPVTP